MAITQLTAKQKGITNPFPSEMYGVDLVSGNNLRRGQVPESINYEVGGYNGIYDYKNLRNNYVIKYINHVYMKQGTFLQIGEPVPTPAEISESAEGDDDALTAEDILAYVAIYPQNGIVKKVRSGLEQRYIRRNPRKLSIIALTPKESHDVLLQMSFFQDNKREEEGLVGTSGGQTVTTPQAQNPENQGDINLATGDPTLEEESNGIVSRMSSLPSGFNEGALEYTTERSDIFDITQVQRKLSKPETFYFVETPEEWIYVRWTASKDSALWSQPSTTTESRRNKIVTSTAAIDSIIRQSGNSYIEEDSIDAEMMEMLYESSPAPVVYQTYLNPDQGPSSTWVYAVRVNKSILENPDSNNQSEQVALKESEGPTEIEKAQQAFRSEARYQSAYNIDDIKIMSSKVANLLRQYNTILENDNIVFKSQLNLSHEANLIEQFPDDIEAMFATNGIATDIDSDMPAGEDLIEIKFTGTRLAGLQVESFFHNGVGPYYRGLGKSGDSSENSFKKYSPQTYGFIFYLNALAAEDGTKEWTEFMQEYVIPYVDYSPSNLVAQKEKNLLKKSKTKNKDKIFKTKAEVESGIPTREKLNQMGIDSTTVYNQIRLSSLTCDTLQGQAMRNFLRLYKATISKTRWKDLTKLALVTLRDELIKDQAAKMLLTDAARYSNNLNLLEQDAERLINKSLYCILDAIGDNFEREVLDPMGLPPREKDLIRRTLNPPKGIRFSSAATVDFYRAWRNQTRTLLVNYMGQLLMGIFSDILRAGLACGPDQGKTKKKLKNATSIENYGSLQINSHLENINLLEIAASVPLTNRSAIRGENGAVSIEISDPDLDQLRQLNNDVSNILLPDQVLSILDGDAAEETIDIIRNMINSGPTDFSDLTLDEVANLHPLEILARQESLTAGDTRYATLGLAPDGFTNETIIRYFSALGQEIDLDRRLALGADGLDQTPDEAFCANNNDFVPPEQTLFPDMSPAQVQSQLDQRIYVKTQQAISMCDLLKNSLEFQIKMDKFKESLSPPAWYESFLASIEAASRSLFSLRGPALVSTANSTPSDIQAVDIENTILGKSLLSVYPNIRDGSLAPRIRTRGDGIVYYLPYRTGNEMGALEMAINETTATVSYFPAPDLDELIPRQARTREAIYETQMFWTTLPPGASEDLQMQSEFWQSFRRHLFPGESTLGSGHRSPRDFFPPLDEYFTEYQIAGYREFEITSQNYTLEFYDLLVNVTGLGDSRSEYNSGHTLYDYLNILETRLERMRASATFRNRLTIPPEEYYDQAQAGINQFRSSIAKILLEARAALESYNFGDGNTVATISLSPRNIEGPYSMSLRDRQAIDGSPANSTQLPSMREPTIQDIINRHLDVTSQYRGVVSNNRDNIFQQIANVYSTVKGQKNIQQVMDAIASKPFEASDRLCLSQDLQNKANACIGVIQSRVNLFIINTLPLLPVYSGWNTPDTLNLLSNYIFTKMKKELAQSGLYEKMDQSLKYIEKLYSPGPRNEGKSIVFTSEENADQRIEKITFRVLQHFLNRLEMNGSEYSRVNLSSLGDMALRNRYYNLSLQIREAMRRSTRGDEANPYEPNYTEEQIEYLGIPNEEIDGWDMMDDFLYYLPVPLLIGYQILFYDKNIDLSQVSPTFWRNSQETLKSADSSLINAYDPGASTDIAVPSKVFPATIVDYMGTERIYYNSQSIVRRVEFDLYQEYLSLTNEYNTTSSELASLVLGVVDRNNSLLSEQEIGFIEAENINNPFPDQVPQSRRGRLFYDRYGSGGPWRLTSPEIVLNEVDSYILALETRPRDRVYSRTYEYLNYLSRIGSSAAGVAATDLLQNGIASETIINFRTRLALIQSQLPAIQQEIKTLQNFLEDNNISRTYSRNISEIDSLRPYPFTGLTSYQENHRHSYSIDFSGNGIALEVVHPNEPRIAHQHTIVNWQVQQAASLCWRENAEDPQSCQTLYNEEGAAPHIHYLIAEELDRAGEEEQNIAEMERELREQLERIRVPLPDWLT